MGKAPSLKKAAFPGIDLMNNLLSLLLYFRINFFVLLSDKFYVDNLIFSCNNELMLPQYVDSINLSAAGLSTPILPGSWAVISAVGKKKLECECPKQASLLLSQLFPFPSIMLTVFENDAAKQKT